MTYLQNDKTLYEQLTALFRGAVLKVAAQCGVHRNTVRNVLCYGMKSQKRPIIRKAAEELIASHKSEASIESQMSELISEPAA